MTPVKIAIRIRPVSIHITAKRRPGTPTGAISPYLENKTKLKLSYIKLIKTTNFTHFFIDLLNLRKLTH